MRNTKTLSNTIVCLPSRPLVVVNAKALIVHSPPVGVDLVDVVDEAPIAEHLLALRTLVAPHGHVAVAHVVLHVLPQPDGLAAQHAHEAEGALLHLGPHQRLQVHFWAWA